MAQRYIVLHLIILIIFFSGSVLFAQNIGVIPTPRQVEMRSGTYVFTGEPKIVSTQVDSLCVQENMEQAYTVEVTPQNVIVRYTTEVGRYYAMLSLKQMIRFFSQDNHCQMPCMLVTDYPAMKYRGWMDDISRGPIPTMEFLKREIETMAQYKMNFFNLYTEHVFKLDKYPDIAPTDGLTASEIKELEDFAAQHHIEFWGNQQCLAHAEKTLRIPFYQNMADTKANYNPCSSDTKDFLQYQLKTVAQAYQSPFFNIDCDETESLGEGKAKEDVRRAGGAAQAYAQHIQWVYDVLKKQGKKVLMWGDIVTKDATIASQLPKDIGMIAWSYAPSDSYVDMLKPLREQGFDFMVAPGMSVWSTVFPDYDVYTKNIANLVRDGYQNGALGMMNTAWDDSGESLFNSCWHGMAWSAEMSWNPIENKVPEQADKERYIRLQSFDSLFQMDFMEMENQLEMLRMVSKCDIPDFSLSCALYEKIWNLFPAKVGQDVMNLNQKVARQMSEYLQKVDVREKQNLAPQYSAPMRFAKYVFQRQKTVAERNVLRCKLYQLKNGNASFSKQNVESDIENLLSDLHQTKMLHLQLWDEECRSYSRDAVERRYDAVAQELLDIPYYIDIESKMQDNGQVSVSLRTIFGDQPIYYSLDGRKPRKGESLYTEPIELTSSAMVRAMTENDMKEDVLAEKFVLVHKGLGKLSRLNSAYSDYKPEYGASGMMALADGVVGGSSYADGTWQGYAGTDVSADFDFGKPMEIHSFSSRFFQNVYDWIMAPQWVEIYTSKDGRNFKLHQTIAVPGVEYGASSSGIYTVQSNNLDVKTRYLRVVAKNPGKLPKWHSAAGQHSYIFCDEFIFE